VEDQEVEGVIMTNSFVVNPAIGTRFFPYQVEEESKGDRRREAEETYQSSIAVLASTQKMDKGS
jgi:hypothetical protein